MVHVQPPPSLRRLCVGGRVIMLKARSSVLTASHSLRANIIQREGYDRFMDVLEINTTLKKIM